MPVFQDRIDRREHGDRRQQEHESLDGYHQLHPFRIRPQCPIDRYIGYAVGQILRPQEEQYRQEDGFPMVAIVAAIVAIAVLAAVVVYRRTR